MLQNGVDKCELPPKQGKFSLPAGSSLRVRLIQPEFVAHCNTVLRLGSFN